MSMTVGKRQRDTEILGTVSAWQAQDGLLLEVDDLRVEFRTREAVAKAINGVSFSVHEAETLAILGESGSGKSVTAQAIMGILDSPPGFITGGEVRYCGQNILTMGDEARRRIRGPEISMVFQDALSSLNPVFPVGWQIGEMFRKHRGMNKADSLNEAVRLMERVQIPGAKQRVKAYPPPVLRRHAATDHDRHGDRARSGRTDRRRADHCARRHRAGAGHEAAQGAPGRAADGSDPDHPRSRRGGRRRRQDRRDVRGEDRGAGRRLRPVRPARPPLHQGVAGLDPAAGPEGRDAGGHRWAAAEPGQRSHPGAPSTRAAPMCRTSAGWTHHRRSARWAGTGLRPATSPSCCWPTVPSWR